MGYGSYGECDRCGRREDDPTPPYTPLEVRHGDVSEEGYERTWRLFCQDCWDEAIGPLYRMVISKLTIKLSPDKLAGEEARKSPSHRSTED